MNEIQLSLFSFPEFYEFEIADTTVIPKDKEKDNEDFTFKLCDLKNIRATVPKLYDAQIEDVHDVEKRFFSQNMKGKLLTNGTGTGKTLVALGVTKRFLLMGKSNILVIVPTDQKCKDWIEEAEDLNIEIHQLQSTQDYKPGVKVTTYANFYQNDHLIKFHEDLIIYDESHYLLQNAQGDATVYLNRHKEVSKMPTAFKKMYWLQKDYYDSLGREKLEEMFNDFVNSTKVLFLSASPFAYIKSLILGDGALWNIYESYTLDDLFTTEYRAYGDPGRYEKFFMDNFGYRMKSNKLTIPETGIDMNLMERNFYEKHKKEGAISGRQIEVPFDYSRQFILLDSYLGNKIDDGIKEMSSKEFRENYPKLHKYYKRKWKYHYTRQLLENLKANMSVERISKHLELGRKVVIFHDYNNAHLTHPFHFESSQLINYDDDKEAVDTIKLKNEIDKFNREYRHLVDMDLSSLINPIVLYKRVFGERVVIYSGEIPKKRRSAYKKEFLDDNSFVDIIVIQRKAGKEGISLHDYTGRKQRVLIELGLPTAPTDCIQVEGRIYRIGLMSNAIYEYMTIQTAFERMAYAHTIAERSRTAENLSMGEKARNMEIIFKEGYQNPTEDDPNNEQGIGGKERDKSLDEISEFQRAISFYFLNQKKNSKTKAKEGKDYFATPEPLGLKMVEWLYATPGIRCLEPSAGHGAIARFFPTLTDNTFVEPSFELASKLRLNVEAGDIIQSEFEKLSIWNKFDKIAMNPPFGHSGKLAAEHLYKAITKHLYRDYKYKCFSRLIAIIPDGESMDKRVREFSENKEFKPFFISHEILLPECTFERAGTKVRCKIIVVDTVRSVTDYFGDFYNEGKKVIDLSWCQNITEFFNEIEDLQLPNYND